jgi:hypothetical protein
MEETKRARCIGFLVYLENEPSNWQDDTSSACPKTTAASQQCGDNGWTWAGKAEPASDNEDNGGDGEPTTTSSTSLVMQ